MFRELALQYFEEISKGALYTWDRLAAATRALQFAGRAVQREASAPSDSLMTSWMSHQLAAVVATHRHRRCRDRAAFRSLLLGTPERHPLFLDLDGNLLGACDDATGFAVARSAALQESILEVWELGTQRAEDKDVKRRTSGSSLAGVEPQRSPHNNLVLEDSDGAPYASSDRAADARSDYCGPRFSAAVGVPDKVAQSSLALLSNFQPRRALGIGRVLLCPRGVAE